MSSIVESTGFSLQLTLAPLARLGVVNVARRISEALQEERSSRQAEDSALRLSLSFLDAIRRAGDDELGDLVSDPPNIVGDPRWDAFLAATVEDECARKGAPIPRWFNDPARFVKPFWHLSQNPSLHHWEFATAPAAFVRHGVLVAAEETANV